MPKPDDKKIHLNKRPLGFWLSPHIKYPLTFNNMKNLLLFILTVASLAAIAQKKKFFSGKMQHFWVVQNLEMLENKEVVSTNNGLIKLGEEKTFQNENFFLRN